MKLKVRHIVFSVFVLLSATNAKAQIDSTTLAAMDRINEIKVDAANYLYAENTNSDWEKAYENAKILLKDRIKAWLQEQQVDDMVSYIAKSDEKFFEIKATRGKMFRAFVYVKKGDIMIVPEARQLLTDTVEKEKPAAKAKQEAETAVEAKQKPEVVVEVKQEPETAAEAKVENKSVPAVSMRVERTPLEEAMLKVTKDSELENFIMGNKKEGRLKEYGTYAKRPEAGKYYILIFDTAGSKVGNYECNGDSMKELNSEKTESLAQMMEVFNSKGYKKFVWFR